MKALHPPAAKRRLGLTVYPDGRVRFSLIRPRPAVGAEGRDAGQVVWLVDGDLRRLRRAMEDVGCRTFRAASFSGGRYMDSTFAYDGRIDGSVAELVRALQGLDGVVHV